MRVPSYSYLLYWFKKSLQTVCVTFFALLAKRLTKQIVLLQASDGQEKSQEKLKFFKVRGESPDSFLGQGNLKI